MKDLLFVHNNPEAAPGLDPWPPNAQTRVSGVRKNRGAFQEDVNLHTVEEVSGGNAIGKHRLTGLVEGALEIFQYMPHFIEGDIEPAGGHRC